MSVSFSYGALSDPLESQANRQGYTLGDDNKILQSYLESILILRFGIDTPDSIHQKLLERLNKMVVKSLKKETKK